MRAALILSFALLSTNVQAATTAPVHATVVDADTAQPLEGASVLYFVSAHAGTITGHGGRGTHLAIFETTTNEKGQFAIAGQRINPHPFWFNTNYDYPKLIIFEPGYSPKEIGNEWSSGPTFPELNDVLSWPKNAMPVKLKRPDTRQDYYMSLSELLYLSFGNIEWECAFKRFPHFILALQYEMARIKKEDGQLLTTPLNQLLDDENHPAPGNTLVKDCGSPLAFFEQFGPLPGVEP